MMRPTLKKMRVLMSVKNYPTASLLRRLAALVYDALIILAIYILPGGLLVTGLSALEGSEELVRLSPATALSLIFTISFLYYTYSWQRGGQTIGMKAWRIMLVNENPRTLQLSQCMLRCGSGFFSLVLFGVGFWWALIDKKQRTWHDMASLTRVVYMPKDMK